mgnify:CR=1 FL=1
MNLPLCASFGAYSAADQSAPLRLEGTAYLPRPLVFPTGFVIAITLSFGALAQVVTDGSLGAAVEISGPDRRIPAALGSRSGPNLLHSFGRFDVPTGESATFEGGPDLRAIVSRVTSGRPSMIDGRIASEAPSADLFFVNPSGIMIGADAEIDVPASFHLSTADFVRFPNGQRFYSAGGVAPPLTIAPPDAFGFLGPNSAGAGPITIDGAVLEFADGATVSIVGREIQIVAGDDPAISVEDGAVRLIAISSDGIAPLIGDPVANTLGAVHLSRAEEGGDDAEEGDAEDDDDGDTDAPDPSIDVSGAAGGSVVLRAGDIRIEEFSIAANSENGGPLQRLAIDLFATGGVAVTGEAQIASIVSGNGRAGDVHIRADRIDLDGDAEFLSDVRGGGLGGAVDIAARLVNLSGDAEIASDVDEGATGVGGAVRIVAGQIVVAGESEISTDVGGAGQGGTVFLTATESIVVREEGAIATDARGAGAAGSAILRAPRIELDQGSIMAGATGAGSGGTVRLEGDRVHILNEATLTAASTGTGPAGGLLVSAATALFVRDAEITTRTAAANGGRISLDSRGPVDILRSTITTSVADGTGNGGDIDVVARFFVLDQSLAAANAVGGDGGDVTISANGLFLGPEALITASSERSVDGAILLDAPEAEVSGGLAGLNIALIRVDDRLRERCAERRPGQVGSIGVVGIGALPDMPLAPLGGAFHDDFPAGLPIASSALTWGDWTCGG